MDTVRDDEHTETVLARHADLLARGQTDRAAALASGVPDHRPSVLLALAAHVWEALAPVTPDSAFRGGLRAQLLTSASSCGPASVTFPAPSWRLDPGRAARPTARRAAARDLAARRRAGVGARAALATTLRLLRPVRTAAGMLLVTVAALWWVWRRTREASRLLRGRSRWSRSPSPS
jgi:hypothetical protein